MGFRVQLMPLPRSLIAAATRAYCSQMAGKVVAECLGTFMIVFMGCGAVMVAERFPGTLSPSAIPLVFGLTVTAMVYAVGHISGAHMNPAVTLAFAVGRHFPVKEILPYCLAQLTGALAASAILGAILPHGVSYGATTFAVDASAALIWEALLTFFLMFVVMAVATDSRAVGTMAGAAVGAVVTVEAFVAGPVTGASMNPARSFGPAVFQGELGVWWVYLCGPIIGAVLAALLYGFIRGRGPSGE